MGLKTNGAQLLLLGGLLNGNRGISAYRNATTEFSAAAQNGYAAYARIVKALADWTIDDDTGLAENTEAWNWPSPGIGGASVAATHYGLHSAGTGGNVLATNARGEAGNPAPQGSDFGFDAGELEFFLTPNTNVTGPGLAKAFKSGLLSGTTYLGVYSAAPSASNPTTNRLDVSGAITGNATNWPTPSAQATRQYARQNRNAINFGLQTVDHPKPTHVALLSGTGASDELLWVDALPSSVRDPRAGASLTIGAGIIQIGFQID